MSSPIAPSDAYAAVITDLKERLETVNHAIAVLEHLQALEEKGKCRELGTAS